MKVGRYLALLLMLATPASCYFEAGTGSTPPALRAPARPPPATSQPVVAKPAPPPVASSAPALSPTDINALLRGTWRRPVALRLPHPGPDAGAPNPPPPPPGPTGCLNVAQTAAVPACQLHLDPACVTSLLPLQRCRTYATTMAPPVAAVAVSCMNHLAGASACDPAQTSACGHAALAQACPDPATVGQLCEIAAGPCKSSQTDCVALLSGLTADAQDAVAHCVAGGCSAGLYACVEGLAPAN